MKKALDLSLPAPHALIAWDKQDSSLYAAHAWHDPGPGTEYEAFVYKLQQDGVFAPADSFQADSATISTRFLQKTAIYDFTTPTEATGGNNSITADLPCNMHGRILLDSGILREKGQDKHYVCVVSRRKTPDYPQDILVLSISGDSCIVTVLEEDFSGLTTWLHIQNLSESDDKLVFLFKFLPVRSGAVVCRVYLARLP